MKNQVSVVTGGDGGMGKAICKELGKSTVLVLAGRNTEKLESAKRELVELGMEAHLCRTDIQDADQTEKLAQFAASLGDVRNVIHTSGVSPANTSAEKIVSINAVGTVHVVKAFYPVMAPGGVLISFSSVAAYSMDMNPDWLPVFDAWDRPEFYEKLLAFGGPESADPEDEFLRAGLLYSISKKFVIQFSQRNVARFAEKGCRILSISPGSYLTPMHQSLIDNQPETAEDQLELIPLGRWGHPYEMGALVAFLCSPGAAYLNGTDILADGGQTANIFTEQIG